MKEEAIKKINTMGNVGWIISIIAKVILIIALIGMLLGTVAIAIIPNDFLKMSFAGTGCIEIDFGAMGVELTDAIRDSIMESIESGDAEMSVEMNGIVVKLDEAEASGDVVTFFGRGNGMKLFSIHNLLYVMVIGMITVGMSLVSVFFAGALCKAFKNCASPFDENVINKLKNFAYSLIPWVLLRSLTDSVMTSFMNGNVSFHISIDLAMLIVVLVILALAYIFKYGAVLQRESDETL